MEISGGDINAGGVSPVLIFYENVSSPSRLEVGFKFIGQQVVGLKVVVHPLVVVFALHAGDGYTVSSVKASNSLSFLNSASVVVTSEMFHLFYYGPTFF